MCSWPPRKKSTSCTSLTNRLVHGRVSWQRHRTNSAPCSRICDAQRRAATISSSHSAWLSALGLLGMRPASDSQFSLTAMMPTRTPCQSPSQKRLVPATGSPSRPVMFDDTHSDLARCGGPSWSNKHSSCVRERSRSMPKSKSWFPGVATCTPKSSMSSIMCFPFVTELISDGASRSPPKVTSGLSATTSGCFMARNMRSARCV
mmetsp:Transcript_9723/g.26388  ORF Transcript_9723/g.26388 Transcript_9723/m.26388 type:complete len:204 (-) Transcript_9723:78-689(-)